MLNPISFMFESPWYWLTAAAVLLILEIFVPGIYLIWLGIGMMGVSVFLFAVPDAGVSAQLFMLCVCIGGAVAAGLLLQKRLIKASPDTLNLGLEGLVGREAVVSTEFDQGFGRVRLGDTSYPAFCDSDSNEPITGSRVKILSITETGVLAVRPVELL